MAAQAVQACVDKTMWRLFKGARIEGLYGAQRPGCLSAHKPEVLAIMEELALQQGEEYGSMLGSWAG
jgi:hypothetical protein